MSAEQHPFAVATATRAEAEPLAGRGVGAIVAAEGAGRFARLWLVPLGDGANAWSFETRAEAEHFARVLRDAVDAHLAARSAAGAPADIGAIRARLDALGAAVDTGEMATWCAEEVDSICRELLARVTELAAAAGGARAHALSETRSADSLEQLAELLRRQRDAAHARAERAETVVAAARAAQRTLDAFPECERDLPMHTIQCRRCCALATLRDVLAAMAEADGRG